MAKYINSDGTIKPTFEVNDMSIETQTQEVLFKVSGTGALAPIHVAMPTSNDHGATKKYVDDAAAAVQAAIPAIPDQTHDVKLKADTFKHGVATPGKQTLTTSLPGGGVIVKVTVIVAVAFDVPCEFSVGYADGTAKDSTHAVPAGSIKLDKQGEFYFDAAALNSSANAYNLSYILNYNGATLGEATVVFHYAEAV